MSKLIKLSVFLAIAISMLIGSSAIAEEPVVTSDPLESITDITSTEAITDETVTAEDLGVAEPTLLPDSNFYFLKNWGRAIQSALTFNTVKKAELKLQHASEKLLETKLLSEKIDKPEILEKAIINYEKDIAKIKEITDGIKDNATENTKVGEFLDKYVKQQILHNKILEKLELQVPEQVMERIRTTKENQLQNFGEVMEKLEIKEQIQERLETGFQAIKGSEFKDFKNLEILKQMEENASETIKEIIMNVRENTLNRLKTNLEAMPEQAQEKFKIYTEKIQGAMEGKMEILEDMKVRLQEESNINIKQKLENAGEEIMNRVRERKEMEIGIQCPSLSPLKCTGRIISEKDINGCPVQRCIITAEIGRPSEEKEPAERVCITLWDPVCGKDGKTYGNKCWASVAGIEISHNGVCKKNEILDNNIRVPDESKRQ